MIVRVALAIKYDTGKDILDYRVPDTLENKVQIGCRVIVPLGKRAREVQGYVVGFAQFDASVSYKQLIDILDAEPMIDRSLVQLALWVSERYLCSSFYVLEYMLPKFARQKQVVSYQWTGEEEWYRLQSTFFDETTLKIADELKEKQLSEKQLIHKFGDKARKSILILLEQGIIRKDSGFLNQGGYKEQYLYTSAITIEQLKDVDHAKKLQRSPKQKELLEYLCENGALTGSQLQSQWPNYHPLIKGLEEKELVYRQIITIERLNQHEAVFYNDRSIALNDEQRQALLAINHSIEQEKYCSFLLHGVTGSGKTEVYLRAIEKALSMGKGAIVLVPEIALTPQLIGRFKAILHQEVEVLHSNLSDGERHDVWHSLKNGKIKVVIGVRSAIFAPVQNLGLIIIDEEHETTYKQSEPEPRYHARDVAIQRGKIQEAVLILGSATPSITSYYQAMQGEHQLITMHHRAMHQPLPAVGLVNMGSEFKQGNKSIISRALESAMEETLSRGEQAILFLNRRGFSSFVLCRECGHTLMCPHCAISLTYHKAEQKLKCHYCEYTMDMPQQCPKCGSQFIRYFGSGTQLVEEAIKVKWPWINILRMDLDTTQNKNAHQEILSSFANGQAQVLIGTQMVTKGLDFPNVTLVGVIAADLTLNMPDYSASERTFQLLTQVAGRAGRGERLGQVIVQTYTPDHYSLLTGRDHDYLSFYHMEIKNRELMQYPPFMYLVRILFSDFKTQEIEVLMEQAADYLIQMYPDVHLLGPAEAPIKMIRNRWRYHMVLKHSDLTYLINCAKDLQSLMNVSRKSKTLRIIVDVEPQSIL